MPLALTVAQAKEWPNPHASAVDLLSEFSGTCVELTVKKIDTTVNNARHKEPVQFL